MMNIRYVTQQLEWTESMKDAVRLKIVEPLARHFKNADFELSVHFEPERKRRNAGSPRFEMWVVLQSFDGRHNEVVRSEGAEFSALVNEVSHNMRNRLRKAPRRKFNPFRFLPFERTA